MKKIRSFLGMNVLLMGVAMAPMANANAAALSEAKARLACGAGKAIGADVRPDGSIKVTCQQSGKGGSRAAGGLGGGVSTEAVVGAVVLIVILGAIMSNRNDDPAPMMAPPPSDSNY